MAEKWGQKDAERQNLLDCIILPLFYVSARIFLPSSDIAKRPRIRLICGNETAFFPGLVRDVGRPRGAGSGAG
jgi:hypothetical protein